jgi:mono/diheme cytochrome c family protein
MNLKSLFVGSIAIVAFSCSPKVIPPTPPPVPTVEVVNAPAVLTQNQIEGKAIFEANCANCHKLYEPATYSAEKWTSILKWMQPKARISDAQREQVYDYVTSGM